VIGNIELADWTVVIAIDAIICDSLFVGSSEVAICGSSVC
jgi:hypothetical protein